MKILMIGAGAVGQVYAYHLQQGGADITFMVKPKYEPDLQNGLVLYPLNRRDKTTQVIWQEYNVITTNEQLAENSYDQVWLSISSTALRGDWLKPTLDACGSAIVVSLQPGGSDRDILLEHIAAERLINGGITLISYQAPLVGETRFSKPGIAYWFPPMSPSPLVGPPQAVASAVKTLTAGGQPAKSIPNFLDIFPFMVTAASPLFATLEAGGWRFDQVARADVLKRGTAASREAMAITAKATGLTAPFAKHFIRELPTRFLLWLAPKIIPLDIDTYMEYHFTKVGDQTRLHLEETIKQAEDFDIKATNLVELREAIA